MPVVTVSRLEIRLCFPAGSRRTFTKVGSLKRILIIDGKYGYSLVRMTRVR